MENSSNTEMQDARPQNTTASSVDYFVCWLTVETYIEYILFHSLFCYVNPALVVFGLLSNFMSLAILRRSGLNKPSNILLFGLVIADIMTLSNSINFGVILLYFGPDKPFPRLCGFQYEENLNIFLGVADIVLEFIGFWGQYVNTVIPVLITLERLSAIFRPITFKSVITKRNTKIAVVLSFLFWLPWNIYYCSIWSIGHRSYGSFTYVAILTNRDAAILRNSIETDVFVYFKSYLPMAIITIGCICLSIKIKLVLRKRKSLTSVQSPITWSPRTTRTLMLTCVVFVVTQTVFILAASLPLPLTTIRYLVKNQVAYVIITLSASSNLLVYLASNRKLYQIFVEIICCRNTSKTNRSNH